MPNNLGLGLWATLREWPRYGNGHATRTTFNLITYPSKRPKANKLITFNIPTFNLQPSNLQPSTF
ncbi:MAG: hypothetical protein F6K50_12535 [Moorea sp. SIO3I7]|nr:hypothetical protein [Moorena sp. SIO3I8]NEN96331.1 hypothetical protein [Moorena sp. SIO3I7]NEO07647.1 hypothetical protein [Moorena sp. SIO3I8]